jgi:hypothetical protein
MQEEQYEYEFESLSNAPNSPDLDGKYLGNISTDFALVADFLKETSYQITARGFSKYPIFVVSRQANVPIGAMLVRKTELNGNQWNYFASFLEDFQNRGLITPEQEPFFKDNYKNIDEFCCLFVLDGDFAKFIYIPYPED